MGKLNELFVDSINKALLNAELVGDKYQKSMAYATTAQALAVYLSQSVSSNETIIEDTTVGVTETEAKDKADLAGDALRLSEKNKQVIDQINSMVKNVEKEQESLVAETPNEPVSSADGWVLPYDENGLPYLNNEDFSIAERVLAYHAAMTPEMQALKQELAVKQGQAIMNEDVNDQPQTSAYDEADLIELENYKVSFGYENNPQDLDNMYHNFTDGVHSSLADITEQTIKPFVLFIKKELAKAYEQIEAWKSSWIGEEGMGTIIANAYGAENGVLSDYLCDGNVFWFNEHLNLYNANAWLNTYKETYDQPTLNSWVQSYFEDKSLTINNITDENVVGFVYYIKSLIEQSA